MGVYRSTTTTNINDDDMTSGYIGSNTITRPTRRLHGKSLQQSAPLASGTSSAGAIKGVLKKNYKDGYMPRRGYNERSGDHYYDTAIDSSPLLSPTPPNVSRVLVKLYPYLIVADNALGILTWTNDDIYPNLIIIVIFIVSTLFFESLSTYFGHIIFVIAFWAYALIDKSVAQTVSHYPTLDDIVQIMNRISKKSDLALSPVRVLEVQDIRRLLFTFTFFTPLYIFFTLTMLTPRKLFLFTGLFILTYYSPWAKEIRRGLWNMKLVRLLSFYMTGLDLGGINKHRGIFITVSKQLKNMSGSPITENKASSTFIGSDKAGNSSNSKRKKEIEFTYVLLENQRRWLGIGWTSAMLSYERAAWTDVYLNPAPAPPHFRLPDDDTNMRWEWIDKKWSLDMTNDMNIKVPDDGVKLTHTPGPDDGFLYFDNRWKHPSSRDSFSKYTRQRRWIRTARLIDTSYDFSSDSEDNIVEGDDKQLLLDVGRLDGLSVPKPEADAVRLPNRDCSGVHSPKPVKVSFSETRKMRFIPSNNRRSGFSSSPNMFESKEIIERSNTPVGSSSQEGKETIEPKHIHGEVSIDSVSPASESEDDMDTTEKIGDNMEGASGSGNVASSLTV